MAIEITRRIGATITSAATLTAGQHTPVDATSGAITVTLPTGITNGAHLSVEKRDASTNTVTVTGNIRGTTSTLAVSWQYESVTFRYDGSTWTPTEGHKTRASLDAAYLQQAAFKVYFPEKYGATGTYSSSVDDTTFVQNALTAAATTGGRVWLSRLYNVPAGGLVANGTVKIEGIGGMLTDANQGATFPGTVISGIRTTMTTGDALTLNAAGCVLTDFAVINVPSSDPTAGTGIKVNQGHHQRMNRVTVQNYWNNIQISGRFYQFEGCEFLDPVNYGLYMVNIAAEADFGDQSIANCVIAMYGRHTTAAAAVRWESGGGIRWSNNKIVGGDGVGTTGVGSFQYGIDLTIAASTYTVELEILGGGISQFIQAGLRVQVPYSSSGFSRISVVGTTFQGTGAPSTVGVLLNMPDSSHTNDVRDFSIDNCSMNGVFGGAIVAQQCRNITIGTLNYSFEMGGYMTAPLITIGAASNDDTRAVTVNRQAVGTLTNTDLILDQRTISNADRQAGNIDHDFDVAFYSNTSASWNTIGYIDLPPTDRGAAFLELELTGEDYDIGPIYARYRRILTKGYGASTVTVTADGTDALAGSGTHYTVQFVTTTAGRVAIQYQMTSGGTTVWGRARLHFSGSVYRSHIGA